jgi:hypothetical protein
MQGSPSSSQQCWFEFDASKGISYEVTPETDLSELVSKVLAEAPEADPATLTFSNQPRGGEQLVLADGLFYAQEAIRVLQPISPSASIRTGNTWPNLSSRWQKPTTASISQSWRRRLKKGLYKILRRQTLNLITTRFLIIR